MFKSKLWLRITALMTAWGAAGGALGGAFYATLLFIVGGSGHLAPGAFIAGFIIGGILGLALGFVEGLVLYAIINAAVRGSISRRHYRTALYGVGLLLTGLVALWLLTAFATAMFSSNGTPNSEAWVFYALIPTIIALGVTWAATANVIRRVEQDMDAASLEQQFLEPGQGVSNYH